MGNKLFTDFYKAFVNLYGAIDSNDAYPIMCRYIPGLKKKDFINDLKERYQGYQTKFQIIKTTINTFIIADIKYSFDDLDRLFSYQGNKPFYVTDSLDEYLRFSNDMYGVFKDENESYLSQIESICLKNKVDENNIDKINKVIFDNIYNWKKFDQKTINRLDKLGLKFHSEIELKSFIDVYYKIHNNTRIRTNRGFTPSELSRSVSNDNSSNPKVELGEEFKNLVLSNEFNPTQFIIRVKNMNLPESVKESLISQMKELLETKKHLA